MVKNHIKKGPLSIDPIRREELDERSVRKTELGLESEGDLVNLTLTPEIRKATTMRGGKKNRSNRKAQSQIEKIEKTDQIERTASNRKNRSNRKDRSNRKNRSNMKGQIKKMQN